MENKKVFIHANETEMSKRIETLLREKLVKSGSGLLMKFLKTPNSSYA